MTSFGAALRQAREDLGLSTQDVALRTKIRGDYLRALEEGQLSALPERTFARSYLARYARELGLDPKPLLSEFDRAMPAPVGSSAVTSPAPARRTPLRLPALALGALLLVGAGAVLVQRNVSAGRTADPSVSPPVTAAVTTPDASTAARTVRLTVKVTPPGARVFLDNRDLGLAPILAFPVDARTQAELRVELAGRQPLRQAVDVSRSRDLRVTLNPTGRSSVLSDAARPTPAPQPGASAARPAVTPRKDPATPAQTADAVKVTYSGPSWTRVTDASGRILFEGTPAAGTVKSFARGVTIRTGNAAAVLVSVDGAPGSALGQAGQVVTRSF